MLHTAIIAILWALPTLALEPLTPLMRVADLAIGESQSIRLHDGSTATVKLLAVHETRDSIRKAIRQASVDILLNGDPVTLPVAAHHLPIQMGDVQIDCPITAGFDLRTNRDWWKLEKDARFRLWPAGSPLTTEGSLVYPVRRRWLSDKSQVCSEPVYVGGESTNPQAKIYYHTGFDIGGSEGLVGVLAAAEGIVVSSGDSVLAGAQVLHPGYDAVYIADARGWYYRYSHLASIDEAATVGNHVKQGQRIGMLGKEGGSGGWSHLHFGIWGKQPSGKQGVIDAYALLWEAYQREHGITLQAMGGPHLYGAVDQPIPLDATRSWSAKPSPHISDYRWFLPKLIDFFIQPVYGAG